MITGLMLAIPMGLIGAVIAILIRRGPLVAFCIGGGLSLVTSVLCQLAGLP